MDKELEQLIEHFDTAEQMMQTYGYEGSKSLLKIRILRCEAQIATKKYGDNLVQQWRKEIKYNKKLLEVIN